jgi:hypothetical protein
LGSMVARLSTVSHHPFGSSACAAMVNEQMFGKLVSVERLDKRGKSGLITMSCRSHHRHAPSLVL